MSNARTATAYAGSPPALPMRSDSPFASVTSDVTMSTMDGDYSYQYDGYYNTSLQRNYDNGQRGDCQTSSDREESDDEDSDYEDLHDSSHLQATNSVFEYSDTDEDYATQYGPGSERRNRKDQPPGSSVRKHKHGRDHKPLKNQIVTQSDRTVRFLSASGDDVADDYTDQEDVEKQKDKRKDYNERFQQSLFDWVTHLAYSFRSPQIFSRKPFISDTPSSLEEYIQEYPPRHYQSTEHVAVKQATATDQEMQDHPSPDFRENTPKAIESSKILGRPPRQTSEESPLLGASYYPDVGSLQDVQGGSKKASRRRLPSSCSRSRRHSMHKFGYDQPHTLITLAAAFLQDYEDHRPPTFAYVNNLGDVTRYQTSLHRFKYSPSWTGFPMALWAAAVCMFISSALEGFNSGFIIYEQENFASSSAGTNLGSGMLGDDHKTTNLSELFMHKRHMLTFLNMIAILIFAIDVWMRHQLRNTDRRSICASLYPFGRSQNRRTSVASSGSTLNHEFRTSRSEMMMKPLMLFCVVLAVENAARLMIKENYHLVKYSSAYAAKRSFVLFSSILKPLVLFYVSSQARDALEALLRIVNVAARVLAMELLLILMFAAVACRLFPEYESFQSLSAAWLSLFQLSTTVVNPSLWMPMYASNRASALFFILFVIIAVFYLHSLVLSVIFQTYIIAASDIHDRSATDREDAIQLAYSSLLMLQEIDTADPDDADADKSKNPTLVRHDGVIDIELVRETLHLVRPHYNAPKINALIEIVDPSNDMTVDFSKFRTRIRQALNASIRTARNPSAFAICIEFIALVVGVLNFVYVIALTSQFFDHGFFVNRQEQIGCIITVFAAFELFVRFSPVRIPDFVPLTRVNVTFDGLALVASLISFWGIGLYVLGRPGSLEWMLMGRSVDMIRAMRFFPIFRDVVRRSGDVIPALLGPMVLVVTSVHIFCYMGMALWGGCVTVGANVGKIVDLYDLNNFNSYQEGIVTIFQVLVVNDWHSIAQVFRFADRCSSSAIVYPFFVVCNLIGVSIILNVMTAFFVQSFVTKSNDDQDGPAEATTTVHGERTPTTPSGIDFHFQVSGKDPVRRISSFTASKRSGPNKRGNRERNKGESENDPGTEADSETSSISETFEFDVYEREGFDRIMQTVTGSYFHADNARQVCHYFEVFESLSPHRDSVGYLVCDFQSLERFGNRRFKTKSIGCLEENELYNLVTDIHSELLAMGPKPTIQEMSITRTFPHRRDPTKALEISACLLGRQPALSLFVSRTTKISATETPSVDAVPPAQQRRKSKFKQHQRPPERAKSGPVL